MRMVVSKGKRVTAALLALLLAAAIVVSVTQPAMAFDKVVYANADPNMYHVEVDLTNKVITVYEKGEKSKKYDKIVKQFICTIGTDATPTPPGSFTFNDMRRRFGYFSKFGVYAQYWVNVAGGIYFHSILYTEPKEGSFTSTSFQALGGKSSHGCIRMLVEDARWLYYNIPAGTSGLLLYKEKDEALRQSLIPTIKPREYKPEADQYENTKRSLPQATLKKDGSFTATTGVTSTVKRGTAVDVVSSGKVSCRVRVNGVEGHIATGNLNFIPNGPDDQKNISKLIKEAQGDNVVKSTKAPLYTKALKTSEIICSFGKKTQVEIVGQTASFYKVEVDGETGYMLKTDITFATGTSSSKPYVKRIENEPAEELDETAEDGSSDADTKDTNVDYVETDGLG